MLGLLGPQFLPQDFLSYLIAFDKGFKFSDFLCVDSGFCRFVLYVLDLALKSFFLCLKLQDFLCQEASFFTNLGVQLFDCGLLLFKLLGIVLQPGLSTTTFRFECGDLFLKGVELRLFRL
jgi:hypothetical protein